MKFVTKIEIKVNFMTDQSFQDLLYDASKGDSISLLEIADVFINGSKLTKSKVTFLKPIKKNLKEGFKWVKLAAEQGNSVAENRLGEMFFYGQGVKKNLSEAFKWIKLSADNGYNEAQYNLGMCYQWGHFVKKDLIKAKSLFDISYKNGFKNVYVYRDTEENYYNLNKAIKLLNQTSPYIKKSFTIKPKKYIEEKYKEAFDLTYKIANSSSPIWFSYILLGSMYLNGVGVSKNWWSSETWLDYAYEDLLSQTQSDPFSSLSKFERKMLNQSYIKKNSLDNAVSKIIDFKKNYFQNIECLRSIHSILKKTKNKTLKNNNAVELILRKSMLLCPEKSVQIEAYTNYENGKQVLFTQQRFVVPSAIAQSGPYYEKLEGESEAAGFYGSFYESTGGFGGMTDSERNMFDD